MLVQFHVGPETLHPQMPELFLGEDIGLIIKKESKTDSGIRH